MNLPDYKTLRPVLAALVAFLLIWLWSKGVKDAATWGGFAVVLYQCIRHRKLPNCGGLGIPVLAWLAICAVSSWLSIDPRHSWRNYWKLLELVAGFVALSHLLRPGRRVDAATEAVGWGMLLVALCDAVRLGLDHLRGTHFQTDGRWDGSHYGFPTIAAAVLALCLVFGVALFLHARRARPLIVLVVALTGTMLLELQTRSVLLSLGAALVLLLAVTSANRRRAFASIAIAGAVLVAAVLASPGLRGKILSGTFSDRAGIWKDATVAANLRPAYGLGYGHGIFMIVHKKAGSDLRTARGVYNHAHNMMLEAALETGWTGAAIWLGLLGTAAWKTFLALRTVVDARRRWTLATLAAAMLALVIYGQFSAFFALAPIYLFWNLLGMLSAAWAKPTEHAP